ncbi:hypothetical protein HYN51_00365 [Limnobaculum parvum]|uniref:Uncharacterized protein n=1 Tax=Limnobaculum parvum TaxID=2172103 RepID=A0A2Y9TU16_9GAMM|nr:hypothetical protein HYN51_00365 [Limnobaculum parvum]
MRIRDKIINPFMQKLVRNNKNATIPSTVIFFLKMDAIPDNTRVARISRKMIFARMKLGLGRRMISAKLVVGIFL